MYLRNRMFLCLSDENHPLVQNLIKITSFQKMQISYGNEKLDTIQSQVNTLQNSRQMIANTYNDSWSLVSSITERLDNIHINGRKTISLKRIKRSVKKTLHKIKQTNY